MDGMIRGRARFSMSRISPDPWPTARSSITAPNIDASTISPRSPGILNRQLPQLISDTSETNTGRVQNMVSSRHAPR